jgi:hypothetical protein
MRKIVRTTALVAVLATALSATTVSAAPSRSRTQRQRDRGSVAEMVKKVMKRFFGVSSLADVISIPTPNDNSYDKNTGTTTGQE